MNIEWIQTTPFLGAHSESDEGGIVLFGCPFDGTSSFRPGSRFGPDAIRAASDGLETYCPVLCRDLDDLIFEDRGNLPMPPGDVEKAIELTYRAAKQVIASGQIPAALGGEHTLTVPMIRAIAERFPKVVILHIDAHMDMRNNYLGVELCHATVLRQICNFIEPSRILQIGQRSGTLSEFQVSEDLGICRYLEEEPEAIREWIADNPLYVTVDLDVLDPSILPGTGTPEPGGVDFSTLQNWITGLTDCRWVGWDVMELSPQLDSSQVSSIVSAKIVRTLLLTSGFGNR